MPAREGPTVLSDAGLKHEELFEAPISSLLPSSYPIQIGSHFELRKNEFYRSATEEQGLEGRRLLREMREAMNSPSSFVFKALWRRQDGSEDREVTGEYVSPGRCRQSTVFIGEYDDSNSVYVTDGMLESIFHSDLSAPTQLAERDMGDVWMEELFPLRLLIDSNVVAVDASGPDTGQSGDGGGPLFGTWFYDVRLGSENRVPDEIIFYSRVDRSTIIQRISNIRYEQRDYTDAGRNESVTCILPVEYTSTARTSRDAPDITYSVKIDYSALGQEIDKSTFLLRQGGV